MGKALPVPELKVWSWGDDDGGDMAASRLATLGVFACTFVLLWACVADRWSMCYDEGIYLDGALRILQGQAPYRDFFVLTGPGTFWLQAAVFKLLGVSFQSGRVLVILELSIMAACVFVLVRRLANAWVGAVAAAVFLVRVGVQHPMINLNHRWDSATFALLALAAVIHASERPEGRRAIALAASAGASSAAAAWCTPTVALAGILLAAWFAVRAHTRRHALAFCGGVAGVSLAAFLWLASQGALWPMIHHLVWTGSNYGAANRFPYGGIIGGYSNLFAGVGGIEWAVRAVIVTYLALPALLPVLSIGGWTIYFLRNFRAPSELRREVALLLLFSVVMVAGTYPRMDLDHLTNILAVLIVPAAALLYRVPSSTLQAAVFCGVLFPTAVFAWYAASTLRSTERIETRAGILRAAKGEGEAVAKVLSAVRPGESLFVFPYAPIFYFLAGGQNPTRYSFLQPGMMTEEDEETALRELKARPPAKVIYADIKESEYLRVWPSSDPRRLRMRRIEAFLHENYQVLAPPVHPTLRFQVLERRPPAVRAARQNPAAVR